MRFRLMQYVLASLLALNITHSVSAEDYQVGERLPQKKSSAPVAHDSYRSVIWDDLMPADWDPMKPVKGLDFSTLQDSDPRAIEALQKVKDFWNDAPIEPKMDGVRIKIPGFVVPLDADLDHAKDFLLVPYFGACIHVPPPPSNQIIYILTPEHLSKTQNKALKKALELQGPIYVSGKIETIPSNTAMAFASYRMQAEDIETYKKALPAQ